GRGRACFALAGAFARFVFTFGGLGAGGDGAGATRSGCVATMTFGAALLVAVVGISIAAAAPPAATASPRSVPQIQSPGYHRNRRRHARPRSAIAPAGRRIRAPQSRQYSCR